jgi:hypothetical protein
MHASSSFLPCHIDGASQIRLSRGGGNPAPFLFGVSKMLIGGYSIKDDGFGLAVQQREAGWGFWLQGDDADHFRDEWAAWQENKPDCSFRDFLWAHDYHSLFQ